MITFQEASDIVTRSVRQTDSETIPFDQVLHRILDEDIISDINMPPFNRSAVDGFACHLSDLHEELDVVEVIAAGREPVQEVGAKQCSRIMTGAIVPGNCDMVFMIEDSELLAGGKVKYTGSKPKSNISLKAEDIRVGQTVLERGKLIQPQDIALLATVGHVMVKVKKRPVVAVISTGDELIHPSGFPVKSQIRNSNAYQLCAQIQRAGGVAVNYGIAPDDEASTFELINRALKENNLVLITGGVSVGDFDFVPAVLRRAGVSILFDKVKVQPGKPTTFGVHQNALVFGLPGNPVSSFVQFEMLVRPLLNLMMGYTWVPQETILPMGVRFERKSSDRLGLIPIAINRNKEVIPVEYHGSAHLASLSYAEGIIELNPGITSINKGELVNVRQI
jgi:molybdopterin molybdotransferase